MRSFYLFCLIASVYSQYDNLEWSSLTSMITPNDIIISDDEYIFSATSGGVLQYNPRTLEFEFITNQQGLIYLDINSISIDKLGRLWLGGSYPNGCLQIYDPDDGIIHKITHLEIKQINDIIISDDTAFAIYEGNSNIDIGILIFEIDDNGLPIYKDYLHDFLDVSITELRDLDFKNDSLYITTEYGVFAGNYQDNLKSSSSWVSINPNTSIKKYLISTGGRYSISDNFVYVYKNNNWDILFDSIEGPVVNVISEENIIHILCEKHYYKIENDDIIYSFQMPEISFQKSIFTSIYPFNNSVVLGVYEGGLIFVDSFENSYEVFMPNTQFTNEYKALTVTKDGKLVATSNSAILFVDGHEKYNYIPYKYSLNVPNYIHISNPNSFQWKYMAYAPGEQLPISIIEKNDNRILSSNSGVVPAGNIWLETPAIIDLDLQNKTFNTIDTVNNVIDGSWGIFSGDDSLSYMVINEMIMDSYNNIWIANPFCEKNGNMVAVQLSNESWKHIKIPDQNSYMPQSIAIDKSQRRIWIGMKLETGYSSGGIKIFKYRNINSDSWIDSTWYELSNPDLLPGNNQYASVWSLAFDKMDFLWVLNEKGIRGYTYQIYGKQVSIDPILKSLDGVAIDFLSHLSYVKGNRIRIDGQNNKWIITHHGIWIIQESLKFWPSQEGLNTENSGLLSNKVYDVAFDNDKGIAYLATEKGISVMEIPFSSNPKLTESIYISPNPFIYPDNQNVLIKNVPSGSTIYIMTITGKLIKKIKLEAAFSQALWDGKNIDGKQVGTGVYLVATSHPTEKKMVSKIAVVRK